MRQQTPTGQAIDRREFLLEGLLPLPLLPLCATLAQAECRSDGDNIAVLVPGFLGSTLSKNGVAIWSNKAWETYDTLLNNPETLRYQKGNAFDDTQIMEAFEIWRVGPAGSSVKFYGPLYEFLKKRAFKKVLPFSYDWRQDMFVILDQLKQRLQSELGIEYRDGKAVESGKHIYVVGHSMGAVLSLLMTGQQLIHPNDICRLILIAPPTAGSADAFRSTFDATQLPGIKRMIDVWWWTKNRTQAWENLHSVIRSFPASYQLMPPLFHDYINTTTWTNPLAENVFDPAQIAAANKLHAAVADAVKKLPLPEERVDLILGTSLDTDGHYFVRAATSSQHEKTYEFKPPKEVLVPDGDGRVLNSSSLYRVNDVDLLGNRVTVRPYIGVRHSELCKHPRVLELLATLLPK